VAKKKHAEHVNHERWLVSYADFITLLFAFFVVMFAVSKSDSDKVGRFSESFQEAIGIELGGGRGVLGGEKKVEILPKTQLRAAKGDPLGRLERSIAEEAKKRSELSGLKVVRRGNELVLRLDAAVLFASGDDDFASDAEPVLEAVSQLVRGKSVHMRVEGHTDDRPIASARYRSNWDLSSARAASVVVSLADRHGFDAARISAGGFAEFQPIADNATDAGRAQNRRVDFVVSMDPEPEASPSPASSAPASSAPASSASAPSVSAPSAPASSVSASSVPASSASSLGAPSQSAAPPSRTAPQSAPLDH